MPEIYGETINLALLEFIGPLSGTVLDLGCGAGGWTDALRHRGAERLIGLEPGPINDVARARYDGVIRTVIEEAELPVVGTVIAADVLEHLVDPWLGLRKLRGSQCAGAKLYISVPNVQFVKALFTIAGGRFPYDEAGGFWDKTHLRWFTRRTLTTILGETGWDVQRTAFEVGSGWRRHASRLSRGRLDPWLGHQIHVAALAV